jgi:hypothetical protein
MVVIASSPGSGPPGWWIAIVVVIAGLGFAYSAGLGYVVLRRRRRVGSVAWPTPLPDHSGIDTGGGPRLRIVGGANVPNGYMRMNATWPLATLEYDGRQVSVAIRGWLFGAKPLFAGPQDLAGVFLVRGVYRTRGIGFRLIDGREWYFWMTDRERVLSTLAQAGYPVSSEEQKARKIWRAEP